MPREYGPEPPLEMLRRRLAGRTPRAGDVVDIALLTCSAGEEAGLIHTRDPQVLGVLVTPLPPNPTPRKSGRIGLGCDGRNIRHRAHHSRSRGCLLGLMTEPLPIPRDRGHPGPVPGAGALGKAADGFLTLFGTKLVLSGVLDPFTVNALSDAAGEFDRPMKTVTQSPHGLLASGTSHSGTSQRTKILHQGDISHPPEGGGLLFQGAAWQFVEIRNHYTKQWAAYR